MSTTDLFPETSALYRLRVTAEADLGADPVHYMVAPGRYGIDAHDVVVIPNGTDTDVAVLDARDEVELILVVLVDRAIEDLVGVRLVDRLLGDGSLPVVGLRLHELIVEAAARVAPAFCWWRSASPQ